METRGEGEMMKIPVNLPKMGLTMEEATIVKWLKQAGDVVNKNDVLLEVETDKSVLEIEAPTAGTMIERLFDEGDSIKVSETICILENSELASDEKTTNQANGQTHTIVQEAALVDTSVKKEPFYPRFPNKPVSPAARRKAYEMGLTREEIQSIVGTGPRNRVILRDITAYSKQAKSVSQPTNLEHNVKDSNVDYEKLTTIRSLTAKKLTESFRDVPQFMIKKRIDVTNINDIKNKLSELNIKVSLNDFIIQGVSLAIQKNRIVNSYFIETDHEMRIQNNTNINVGLAVAIDGGLVVPVVKDADQLSLIDIARKREEFIQKARSNRLTPNDMNEGTITISNLGAYGVVEFNAIINKPEAAILAIGSVVKQPVVNEKDEIVVKPILTITASFDHRILDGAVAAQFMKDLTAILESKDWKIV